MKKIIITVLCILIPFSFSGCGGLLLAGMAILDDNRASKDEICAYVRENEKTIIDCIKTKDYAAVKNSNIVKEISFGHKYIEFDCGGAGFGSATSYCGFYFSEEDDMTAIWCGPTDNEPLQKSGNGYMWKQKDGGNTYYTENICGHFYYYESSF